MCRLSADLMFDTVMTMNVILHKQLFICVKFCGTARLPIQKQRLDE